MEIMVKVKTN